MPIKTDLSVSPYFDDTNINDNYYKILFKPSVAVQARELNSLQTLLQAQIEKFGNNIFKRGTIIDGCNFIFYDDYPYIKINDLQKDGLTVIPNNYLGFLVRNSNNLIASIINTEDGFESTDPDLKTLYLAYLNSGDSGSENTFQAGQTLTVYDSNNSIFRINIDNSGSGYSNTDNLIITPRLIANVTTGIFSVGDTITDIANNVSAVIVAKEDLTTRLPVANLGGSVAVNSGNTTIVGTANTFDDNFVSGDYIALYSNSTTYSLLQVNTVSNGTHIILNSAPTFTNATSIHANVSQSSVILTIRPTNSALSNKLITEESWTFSVNSAIQGASINDTANITQVLGAGARGIILTDAIGRIQLTSVTERGSGYTFTPYVSIQTNGGTLASFNAQNYLAQIDVSSVTGSVGSGYAFGVTEGYIYQKGYFVRVEPQTVIVEKYNTSPNNVIVTFNTEEAIIDSNIDTNLNDNATGEPNENAPGADRLKLFPTLEVMTADSVQNDPELFVLAEWNGGVPFKQNQRTQYNVILDEIALRTKEESGDYVVDRFLSTTTSPANTLLDASYFNVVVDPGTAYIDGYRVQTLGNFTITTPKSTSTRTTEDTKVSIAYDSYIKVNELGGLFEFDTAPVVEFYNTSKQFISNTSLINTGNTNPVGTKIGEARIRNLIYDDGVPGTSNAVYKMYLFDIQMNAGKNFKNIRSVYYNGSTVDGIADIVLEEFDFAASNSTVNVLNPVLYNQNDGLLFKTGFESILNCNNIVYSYRTIDDTLAIANNGTLTVSIASTPNVNFPYTGVLSTPQLRELYVAPSVNVISQNLLTAFGSINSVSNVVQTTDQVFLSTLKPGDYIQLSAGGSSTIKRITSISNNIYLNIDSSPSFSNTGNTSIRKAWPQYVPIPLHTSNVYSANVDSSGDVLTINLGNTITAESNAIIAYNVERRNFTPTNKVPNRDIYVKLNLANNENSTEGPWCLGVPDIFRLKNVWIGNSSVSESDIEVTDEFYIDHNQNINYYNLGYLFKNKKSRLVLTEDDYLLVKFDCFTVSTQGFYNVTSYTSGTLSSRIGNSTYIGTDNMTLSELKTNNVINTHEIPEVYTDDGKYYDLINSVDFRPYVTATATLASSIGSATINPPSTVSFGTSTKYFPVPDTTLVQDVEYFLTRTDNVILGRDGQISIMQGSSEVATAPAKPKNSLILNSITHPVYPSIPINPSNNIVQILDKNIANERFINVRSDSRRIVTTFSNTLFNSEQPKSYTMKDIGKIERRVSDLEYYVSLNLVETQVKDLAIPSSIDPRYNRFKYGFFADSYTSEDYSDLDHPEYAASFENNTLIVPFKEIINIMHANLERNTVEYSNHKLISQNNATYKDADCVCPPAAANIIFTTTQKSEDNRKKYSNDNPRIETLNVKMASKGSANATLWMNFYGGADKIEIYQGNNIILTGDNAVKLTASEANKLKNERPFNKSGEAGRFDWKDAGPAGDGRVKNVAKITWTHNPSLGVDYTIKVYKQSRMWRFRLDYPVDGTVGGNNGCKECDNLQEPTFNGIMSVKPEKLRGKPNPFSPKKNLIFDDSRFDIVVKGLKPNTVHKFYFYDKDESSSCNPIKPYRGGLGSDLKTDSKGMIVFKYFFKVNRFANSSGSKNSKNNFKQFTNDFFTNSDKLMVIKSLDEKSIAKYKISVVKIESETVESGERQGGFADGY